MLVCEFETLANRFGCKYLLPAEKGGLRTVDVSECVCVSFDFQLNFNVVIGSFIKKHVLIQTDQSESREGLYGPIQTDQSGSREQGGYVWAQTDQTERGDCVRKQVGKSEFSNDFTIQGYK